jgi:outer membrane protein assembly factor BamB
MSWKARTGRIESPAVVGLGSVWAASRRALYRLDAATGRVEAKIPVEDAAAQLAVGGGRVWMVSFRETSAGEAYELLEIDPRTERIVKQATLDGPVGNISFGSGALWMGRDVPTVSVIRIDPITLRARVFATKLDTAQP